MHVQVHSLIHACLIHVLRGNWTKKGSKFLDWLWANNDSWITSVTRRVLRTCHGIWSNSSRYFLFLFVHHFLSFLLASYTRFLVPFEILALVYFRKCNDNPPSPFFVSRCCNEAPRNSPILLFIIELVLSDCSSTCFGFSLSLYTAYLDTRCPQVFARFRVWYRRFPTPRPLDLHSIIFSSSSDIFFSRISRDFTLFSISPFYFYLSFASFRILRIRFSARALYVYHSFSRIVPVFLTVSSSPPSFILFLFYPRPPPSLISLAASPSSIYFDRS